jgi:hypothetical protein
MKFAALLFTFSTLSAQAWTVTPGTSIFQKKATTTTTGPLFYADDNDIDIAATREEFLLSNNVEPLEKSTKDWYPLYKNTDTWVGSPQWERLARDWAAEALEPVLLPLIEGKEEIPSFTAEKAHRAAVRNLPKEMSAEEWHWMEDKLQELIFGTWTMRFQYLYFWKVTNPFSASTSTQDKIQAMVSFHDNELLQSKSFLDDIPWPSDTLERLSVRYSIPESQVGTWIDQYGEEEAERIADEARYGYNSAFQSN